MKFNADCSRDILLFLEEKLIYNTEIENAYYMKPIYTNTIVDELLKKRKYTEYVIVYNLEKLAEARYIILHAYNKNIANNAVIDITMQGHEFLNMMRKNKFWEAIKKRASVIEMNSIPKLMELGETYFKEFANNPADTLEKIEEVTEKIQNFFS